MKLIEIPLRTVRFHGSLVKAFGKEFKYRATTVPKAIDAMKNLLPGFERYMLEAHKRGLTFSIFVGKRNIGQDELDLTKGTEDIHLVPVVIGSKRAGLFQTILGVALVATAAYFTGGAAIGMGAGFSSAGAWGAASLVGVQPAGALRWLLEGANGEGVAPQSADVMLSFHFSA
ncbi:tail assembly protein [Serratia entomophila]|uniref:tail assembly protein n=1 Tax=Serratia entomophila TaxID=42906 RepID=UPI00217B4E88|nr:tail assembly protein [Serratia entomophila]CAI1124063.1 Phage-related protein, tail component [Serratia entomophila]CAI1851976.1 Phage-related protein, tail component [Serratia entomophila]CAI1856525.1 Phage-related protein, tail component [Serratia entomophila]CAI1922205.1 Phage-related protein, tail component [Serratia entomophila]CAI1952834.1 Phage-related protein, tail component [Serratia entomophila]